MIDSSVRLPIGTPTTMARTLAGIWESALNISQCLFKLAKVATMSRSIGLSSVHSF